MTIAKSNVVNDTNGGREILYRYKLRKIIKRFINLTANILTAKNTIFHGVMISRVLSLPFWHLITVPSTADKWH